MRSIVILSIFLLTACQPDDPQVTLTFEQMTGCAIDDEDCIDALDDQ